MSQHRFNYYEFHEKWRAKGTVEEVTEILFHRFTEINRWWPRAFMRPPLVLEQGDEQGKGQHYRVLEQAGRFPLAMFYETRILETSHPYGMKLQVTGDFDG